MEIVSLVFILIAFAAMMYFGYKGAPIVLVAPLCSILVCLTSGINLVDGMGGAYMGGAAGFFSGQFLTIFTGAIFARLMSDSGAARSLGLKFSRLARKFKGHEQMAALWTIPALSFILSYGGISVFVAFFTVIAVAKELFEEMNIPWRMYGVTSLGVSALALTMAPGSPSVNNAIAAGALGTTAMAAPVLGILACIFAIVLGGLYFSWEMRGIRKRGEGFEPTGAEIKKVQFVDPSAPFEEMNLLICLLPSIVLFVVLNVFKQKVYVASAVAIAVAFLLFWKRLDNKLSTAQQGALQGMNSICTVCIVVGFGSVVAAAPGYQIILDALTKIPGPGYFQVLVAVNIAAGVTSSSSGGLTIAMNSLADRFVNQMGLNPEVVHRLATISSGGLDSLPCNGVILNELAQAKLTPKQGYRAICICSLVIPIIVSVLVALVTIVFGVV